jgi:hypothetical protein
MGPRASLDMAKRKILNHCQESDPSHPAHSQVLDQLNYPGSFLMVYSNEKLKSNGYKASPFFFSDYSDKEMHQTYFYLCGLYCRFHLNTL